MDHVIVIVHDLDAAASRYYEQHGLASVAGGRHPANGTANRIVPLGTSYIELMAPTHPSNHVDSALLEPEAELVGGRSVSFEFFEEGDL